MSSNRTLYGTISATAPYGSSITQLDVKFAPTQSSTPSLMPETNTVYLTRPTEGTGELMELVGGSVAWNQLEHFNQNTSTIANVVCTNNNDGTFTLNGTSNATGRLEFSTNAVSPTIVSGHKYYGWSNLQNASSNLQYVIIVGGALKTLDNRSYAFYTSTTDSGNIHGAIRFTSGQAINLSVTGGLVDLTQMFGSTIADYVYSLEQATAGSGVQWLTDYDLIDDQYHAYSAPTLQSVEATAHVTKDANDTTIATYPLDSDLVLRGIPKLDSNNALYYDGDTYEWDGTVTRKWGFVDLSTLNWEYNDGGTKFFYATTDLGMKEVGTSVIPSGMCEKYSLGTWAEVSAGTQSDKSMHFLWYTNGRQIRVFDSSYTSKDAFVAGLANVHLLYELATPTTETADTYTAVQTVEDGGTEEFTTSNGVPVGVKGRFANAVPMEGVDSFTVTANDGTVHTYPVTLSEEVYSGVVDMLTGEAVSDMASIAEYNGETINSPWLSSLDVYSLGATPTKGAQVVYPITPEEVTATITGDPTELGVVTSATSTKGTVKWGNMMPLGLKAELTIDSPF